MLLSIIHWKGSPIPSEREARWVQEKIWIWCLREKFLLLIKIKSWPSSSCHFTSTIILTYNLFITFKNITTVSSHSVRFLTAFSFLKEEKWVKLCLKLSILLLKTNNSYLGEKETLLINRFNSRIIIIIIIIIIITYLYFKFLSSQ
jgi:hypothetical protein